MLVAEETIRTARVAVGEEVRLADLLRNSLQPTPRDTTLLFCSSLADLSQIERSLHDFPGIVVGCTTAGEIGSQGIDQGHIAAATLPASIAQCRSFDLGRLDAIDATVCRELAAQVEAFLSDVRKERPTAEPFSLLLVDGLTSHTERVVAQLQQALPAIPLVGGSAGDDQQFRATHVLQQGRFDSHTGCLIVFATERPFHAFKSQNFLPTDQRMVVSSADPSTRTVHRLNGRLAVEEYARIIGVHQDELDAQAFARHPTMLRVGGDYYLRSIRRGNSDGSLTFSCAVETGRVLLVARGIDFAENMEQALGSVRNHLGAPSIILSFECALRRRQILETGLKERINQLYTTHNVFGFHTYGEQYNGHHSNQSFTGIALGK